MVYYKQDTKTQKLTEICNVPFADATGQMEMPDEQFKVATGFDGYAYFIDYMQTDEYLLAKTEYEEGHILRQLRRQREKDCFEVINRGKPWYDTLTEEQNKELIAWYNEWLDVTKTRIIPTKPEWLK